MAQKAKYLKNLAETPQSRNSKLLFSIEKQYYLTLFRSWSGMVGSLDPIFWFFLIFFVKILVPQVSNDGYTSQYTERYAAKLGIQVV